MLINRKFASLTCTAAAGMLILSACGGTSSSNSSSSSAAEPSSSASASAHGSAMPADESQGASASAGSLKMEGAWVKATNGGMTAVFGKITNTGDKAVKITGASSTATDTVQLHTTSKNSDGSTKMQQVQEFTIEPGATLELKSGGDHIMLMNMSCSLMAGGETTVTLTADDGTSLDIKPVARDYSGAKEEYKGDSSHSESASATASGSAMAMEMGHSSTHEGHEHGDHSHGHGGASESALPECK